MLGSVQHEEVATDHELTSVDLTLEVDLEAVRVGTGSDVDGGHVQVVGTRPYALDVADQVRVVAGLILVPHYDGIVVMLE